MERIKGANGELMKYSMQPMDGEGHLTLYRYNQLAVGGADNAHLEFWQEIEELRKQLADAQATIAALQAQLDEQSEKLKYHDLFKKWQCWRDPDELVDEYEKWQAAIREHQSLKDHLTQRTAELEAANKLLYRKNCALGRAETIINDLQAELERVRERVGQRGLEVVMIGKVGHYVSTAVKEELERVRGELVETKETKHEAAN